MMERFCDMLFYGLGEEAKCGKPASFVLNKGTPHEEMVCNDCAQHCHPSRLVEITPDLIQPGDSLEVRSAKELRTSRALLGHLREEQALARWGKERTPAPKIRRAPR